MKNLFPFHLGNVIRKLSEIRIAINLQHQQPFPKSQERLLSRYSFVPRRIKIKPSGEIAGGLARFVTSLIDFSFVRSICASAYSPVGGHAYDPVSLFLLELFRYLEKFSDLKTFLSVVRDEEKGNIIASMPASLFLISPVRLILLISKIASGKTSILKSLRPWLKSCAS